METVRSDIAAAISPFVFDHQPVFERLPLQEIARIQDAAIRVKSGKGEVLFAQGSPARGAYWLRSGKVKIYQDDEMGQRHILYIYTPGDLIGYRQLFTGEPYPISAEALDDVELAFLPAEIFHSLVRDSAFFSRNLLEVLSREFTVWVNQTTVFLVRPLRNRLALILLILHEKYRTETLESNVPITFSRTDLADFAGAQLETVVRMLNRFKKEGLVNIDGRRLYLFDIPSLIELARGN